MPHLQLLLTALLATLLGPVAAIIGGSAVHGDNEEYSVAISQPGLAQRGNTTTTLICNGVLAAEDRVITLAECLDGLDASEISIRAGMSDYTFQTHTASSIIIHPLYNSTTLAYDIALIQLTALITNVTAAAIIPNTTTYPTGTVALLGWGATNTTGVGAHAESSQLETASVATVAADTCAAALAPCPYTLDPCQHFCTTSNGTGAGYGDAGGPVTDSEGYVVGLISGNPGCAQAKQLALELSLAHLHDWILQTSFA